MSFSKLIKNNNHQQEIVKQSTKEVQDTLTPEFISKLGMRARDEVYKWLLTLRSKTKNQYIEYDLACEFYSTPLLNEEIKVFLASGLTNLKGIVGLHHLLEEEFQLLKADDPSRDFQTKITQMNHNAIERYFRTEMILERFYILLLDQFPDHINQPKDCPWTWNDVGFVKARIRILYCNLGHQGKYIALFGSSSRQHGYSGLYKHMEVYDIMITGLMKSYSTHQKDALPHYFAPGEISDLRKNVDRYYHMMSTDADYATNPPSDKQEEPYMIDMGVGNIVSAFPDGVIKPAFFLDYDYSSMIQQMKSSFMAEKKNCTIL